MDCALEMGWCDLLHGDRDLSEHHEMAGQLNPTVEGRPFVEDKEIHTKSRFHLWMGQFMKTHSPLLTQKQGLVNVPIEHHPTIGDIISSRYGKVMWNKSPKRDIYQRLKNSQLGLDVHHSLGPIRSHPAKATPLRWRGCDPPLSLTAHCYSLQ